MDLAERMSEAMLSASSRRKKQQQGGRSRGRRRLRTGKAADPEPARARELLCPTAAGDGADESTPTFSSSRSSHPCSSSCAAARGARARIPSLSPTGPAPGGGESAAGPASSRTRPGGARVGDLELDAGAPSHAEDLEPGHLGRASSSAVGPAELPRGGGGGASPPRGAPSRAAAAAEIPCRRRAPRPFPYPALPCSFLV
ncbi:unnamed protein product [Urochloa humidicola]